MRRPDRAAAPASDDWIWASPWAVVVFVALVGVVAGEVVWLFR